jgi:hypothetical protein
MARKNLGTLIHLAEDPAESPVSPVSPESAAEAAPEDTRPPEPSEGAQDRHPAPAGAATTPAMSPATGPRYLALTRKEARFTDDQLESLSVLTRQLNKARQGRGERITDNTLIRVAVDLLLERAGELAGHDEGELRKSVGL